MYKIIDKFYYNYKYYSVAHYVEKNSGIDKTGQ
jgi:hypothetical protein